MRIAPPDEIERAFVAHYADVRPRPQEDDPRERCIGITAASGSRSKVSSEILLTNLPTLRHIFDCVCAHYCVSLTDILSIRRDPRFVKPRHVAQYLARQLTTKSLPQIGRALGRDHTSVHYAIQSIESKMRADASLAVEIATIARKISSSPSAHLPSIVLANDNCPAFRRKEIVRRHGFWTETRLKKLREMWVDGATDQQCAKHFGVSANDVRMIVARNNITREWP